MEKNFYYAAKDIIDVLYNGLNADKERYKAAIEVLEYKLELYGKNSYEAGIRDGKQKVIDKLLED